ncbi:MAG: winged helix-turn-helix domain-containing protein [Candidatus Acidiferrales bacterium]
MRPEKPLDEIELDLGRYQLRRRGRTIKLARQPMELLIFLVSRRGQMVSRADIVAKLWHSDLFVDTGSNINHAVRKIRAALNDNIAKPRFLETVVGKGYRFIGPVRVIDPPFPQSDSQQARTGDFLQHSSLPPERPSLAILPLRLLGNLSDEHGISLGFADALVARLGNLHGLDVLPTSATLNIPLEITPAAAGSRLGVRFVVHGAIRELKGERHLALEMFDTHLQRSSLTLERPITVARLPEVEDDFAKQVARSLNRPLHPQPPRPRYSNDPLAYSEFMRGYRLSSSGDTALLDEASRFLSNAVVRDPAFSLAHATLAFVCATRHFELDPASIWLEKAEFHCQRALELNPDLPEGHVAKAFLLWGPSKNFQHLEAIAELRRALALQKNLPHAYNRLGTILAHIGLFDHAREMYERGRAFHPSKAVSHSLVQVYVWGRQHELAEEEIRAWRAESPGNKYALCFSPQVPMIVGDWKQAKLRLDEALQVLPEEPLLISLLGLFYAASGQSGRARECLTRACVSPKSFGHAHHTYYQIAGILSVLGEPASAFEWLERAVTAGFPCWPFFINDPCLENLRSLPQFEVLISSLQAKYPDHLGLL